MITRCSASCRDNTKAPKRFDWHGRIEFYEFRKNHSYTLYLHKFWQTADVSYTENILKCYSKLLLQFSLGNMITKLLYGFHDLRV